MNEFFGHLRGFDIISAIVFLPTLGAIILLLLPKESEKGICGWALACSIAPLIFVLRVLQHFNPAIPGIQFRTKLSWIPSINVDYFVGVDGLSIAMVLLVSILVPLVILGAFPWVRATGESHKAGIKPFYALILLEQTGLYGAFTTLNFFHWFIFWEASLVPMFFIIKMYGNEDRTYAAYQFFVYTFLGSVAMLIGMQFIYLATNSWDFEQLAIMARTPVGTTGDSELVQKIQALANTSGVQFLAKHAVTTIFALVFLGFAIKVPLWPFHTWLPVSYTQAPTPASMILTGLMSKMGVYGFLRIVLPLFGPTMAHYSTLLITLAIATILFGAITAYTQRDLKMVISYSSVNHLGYCLLGIFVVASVNGFENDKALALNGVIVQMFAHGLSAAGLFYLAGVIEERAKTRNMADLGGLRKTVPVMAGLMGIIMFASLGLPGLGGFVGEFMIFRGSFPLQMGLTSIAVVGILFTALYLLRMTGKVFFGPQSDQWNGIKDLNVREIFVSGMLALLLFIVGMMPSDLIALSNAAVVHLAKIFS
jgi:NADH-quinone oxidoreductase subunit M